MCAPSPPPAPDYIGAAEEQGQQNIEAARVSAELNNPNVISPYGTQTVKWGTAFDQAGYDRDLALYEAELADFNKALREYNISQGKAGGTPSFAGEYGQFPGSNNGLTPFGRKAPVAPDRKDYIVNPNRATITQQFSPEQQALYEQQVRVKQLLGGLAEQGANSLYGIIGKPLDFSGAPSMPGSADATRQKVINAMMARVNEDTDVARDNANSNLIAAGIRPGTAAYDNAMRNIDRAYNDARNQAFLASGQEASRDFGLDAERRRQFITELLSQRQIPLNEITALMSGSQVYNPFAMPGFNGVQGPQPAPTFAAQNALAGYNTDLFNAQAAGAANQQAGLMGLGSSALMAGGMVMM